jgi:type I restriction enzyme S subunit
MNSEWRTTNLGSIAQIGAGNSAPQGAEFFEKGSYPFFRTADAGRVKFGEIHDAKDHINEKGIKGLRRFPKGTILFPKSGASTFLNHRVMLGVDGYVASHLATIVANASIIDKMFLLYFLSTISAQDLIQDHAYPSLNLPLIAGIPVPHPPLSEQQRIVRILDEAFAAISTAKANAEKNLKNARALFAGELNEVFSRRREGWKTRTLGEVTRNTETVNPLQTPEKEFDYIDVSSISNLTFHIETTQRLKGKNAPSRARKLVKTNDVLFATVRPTLQRIAIVPEHLDNQVCSTGYIVLRAE